MVSNLISGSYVLTGLVGFVYPAYISFKAIESPDLKDDRNCLIYWTVYAFCQLFDPVINSLLSFVPAFYFLKVILLNCSSAFTYGYSSPDLKDLECSIKSWLSPSLSNTKRLLIDSSNRTRRRSAVFTTVWLMISKMNPLMKIPKKFPRKNISRS